MNRKYMIEQTGLEEVENIMQKFLESNFVDSVSFSYSLCNSETGVGVRTTIEKTYYTVEEI